MPFEDLRAVHRAFGVTVNDVALSIITGAVRRVLLARDESPERHPVRSLVPVSLRAAGAPGPLDNRVSALVPELPVEVDVPPDRLRQVHRRMLDLKESGEAVAGQAATAASDMLPGFLEESVLRLTVQVSPPLVTTVTTNVPGSPVALSVLGRDVVEMLPYVPLKFHVRLGVAMTSYGGRFSFGVTVDETSFTDLELFVDALRDETGRLVAATRRSRSDEPDGYDAAGRPTVRPRAPVARPRASGDDTTPSSTPPA